MKKRIIPIIVFALMIHSVVALQTYEKTDISWHIYDDFETHNTEMWTTLSGCTIGGGVMSCNAGDGVVLTNPDYTMNPLGEWIIEVGIVTSQQNAYGGWFVQNNADSCGLYTTNSTKFLGAWHRNRAGYAQGTLGYRNWNGTDVVNYETAWGYGNGNGLAPGDVWRYEHFINEDETGNLAFYKDNGLRENYTTVFTLEDYYEDTPDYYLCADGRIGTSSELIRWDWVNITYFAPEQDWVVDSPEDTSFGSRRRRSKASRTATIEAPVELEPVKEPSTEGLSNGQKLVIVALGGVVAYSIFTAKPKPRRIKRRK